MDLSQEVTSTVAGGAIPGFSGSVVEVLLCITGSLASMAAVALVDLLLCLVMAKEADLKAMGAGADRA